MRNLTLLLVERFLVRPDKQKEFLALSQRFLNYKKKNPEIFKEVKSFQRFAQTFGDIVGEYMEIWLFDNLAGLEKWWTRVSKDEEMKKIDQQFALLIDPATWSMTVWTSTE